MPKLFKNPIGHGTGSGAEVLGFRNPAGVLTIDTYFLRIALEYGVVGFVVYYGMFIASTYIGARSSMDVKDRSSETMLLIPASVSLFNFLFIKSVFSNDENHPLAFMLMGMVVALTYRLRKEQGTLFPAKANKAVTAQPMVAAPSGRASTR